MKIYSLTPWRCGAVVLGLVIAVPTLSAQPAPPAGSAPAFPGAPGPGGPRGRGPQTPPGPPAPVPAAVAIPRPTAAEIAQVKEALNIFLDSSSSGVKPLLEKYPGLVSVQPPRANSAIAPVVRSPRHAGFVETAKKGDIDLLLDGDSITDWWIGTNGTPTAAYTKYFGDIRPRIRPWRRVNSLGVLQARPGFQPKAIMLMIGTNNAANTAPEVAEGIGAIVLEMRKDFPNAKILLLGIFPRGDPTDPNRVKIAEVNKIISKLDDQQHVFYMDIGAKFLDENGVFLPDAFRTDKLHPQEKGYDIWGAAVKDTLDKMLK